MTKAFGPIGSGCKVGVIKLGWDGLCLASCNALCNIGTEPTGIRNPWRTLGVFTMDLTDEAQAATTVETDLPSDMGDLARDYLDECINEFMLEAEAKAQDMSWMSPSHRPVPAQALSRIKSICHHFPELCSAIQAVGATHISVPREVLAMALKKFRTDLDMYDTKEVASLLTAIANGGRSGYDSVLKNRKKGGGAASTSLPWGVSDE
jgi:hypothetical protein